MKPPIALKRFPNQRPFAPLRFCYSQGYSYCGLLRLPNEHSLRFHFRLYVGLLMSFLVMRLILISQVLACVFPIIPSHFRRGSRRVLLTITSTSMLAFV